LFCDYCVRKMTMPCRHTAARIHEIVKATKALVAGQSVEPKKHGSHGRESCPFSRFSEISP